MKILLTVTLIVGALSTTCGQSISDAVVQGILKRFLTADFFIENIALSNLEVRNLSAKGLENFNASSKIQFIPLGLKLNLRIEEFFANASYEMNNMELPGSIIMSGQGEVQLSVTGTEFYLAAGLGALNGSLFIKSINEISLNVTNIGIDITGLAGGGAVGEFLNNLLKSIATIFFNLLATPTLNENKSDIIDYANCAISNCTVCKIQTMCDGGSDCSVKIVFYWDHRLLPHSWFIRENSIPNGVVSLIIKSNTPLLFINIMFNSHWPTGPQQEVQKGYRKKFSSFFRITPENMMSNYVVMLLAFALFLTMAGATPTFWNYNSENCEQNELKTNTAVDGVNYTVTIQGISNHNLEIKFIFLSVEVKLSIPNLSIVFEFNGTEPSQSGSISCLVSNVTITTSLSLTNSDLLFPSNEQFQVTVNPEGSECIKTFDGTESTSPAGVSESVTECILRAKLLFVAYIKGIIVSGGKC